MISKYIMYFDSVVTFYTLYNGCINIELQKVPFMS